MAELHPDVADVKRWVGRFWRHVDKAGPLHPYDPARGSCWTWMGKSRNRYGHGTFAVRSGVARSAHRLAWYATGNGWPEEGVVLRHSCDNAACVNPGHIELGSQADNMRDMVERRRHWKHGTTHCPQGHPYDDANTYRYPDGRRDCRTCAAHSKAAHKARVRAARLEAGDLKIRRLDDAFKRQLADEYLQHPPRTQGRGFSAIAKKYGVSSATVYSAVQAVRRGQL